MKYVYKWRFVLIVSVLCAFPCWANGDEEGAKSKWESLRLQHKEQLLNLSIAKGDDDEFRHMLVRYLDNPLESERINIGNFIQTIDRESPFDIAEKGNLAASIVCMADKDLQILYAYSRRSGKPARVVYELFENGLAAGESQKYGMWFLENDLNYINDEYYHKDVNHVYMWTRLLKLMARSPSNSSLSKFLVEYPFARGAAFMVSAYREESPGALLPESSQNMLQKYYINVIENTSLQKYFLKHVSRRNLLGSISVDGVVAD